MDAKIPDFTEKMIRQLSDEDLATFDEDCDCGECICCIAKVEKYRRLIIIL